jgi:hypothetical protein
VRCNAWLLCKERAEFSQLRRPAIAAMMQSGKELRASELLQERAMRLTLEIATAALLVICISATSAAFAAGSKPGRSADGLGCSFSATKNASPAARCAAIRRQCGGKFYANYCGDKMLSAM